MIHSPIEKRNPVEPLRDISRRLDELRDSLRDHLNEDPLELQEPIALRTSSSQIKAIWRDFMSVSVRLTERLTKIGSLEEAQESREDRSDIRIEVRQYIGIINEVLKRIGSDEVSNVDTRSVASAVQEQKLADLSLDFSFPSGHGVTSECSKSVEPAVRPKISAAQQILNSDLSLSKHDLGPVEPAVRPKRLVAQETLHDESPLPKLYSTQTLENSTASKGLSAFSHVFTTASTGESTESVVGTTESSTFTSAIPSSVPFKFISRSLNPTIFPTNISGKGFNRHVHEHQQSIVGDYDPTPQYLRSEKKPFQPLVSRFPESTSHSYNYPRYHRAHDPQVQPAIDGATLHLIKQELFKTSNSPFSGDPHYYRSWLLLLENRMRGLQLEPLDVVSVLLANTTGEPNKMVKDYLSAGAAAPHATLERIWLTLNKQYGSPVRVCHSMQKKLQSVSVIRPPDTKGKLQDLVHICRMIEANMPTNPELQMYNLSIGQKQVWTKLPDWLQQQWRTKGYKFSLENLGNLPPFEALVDFIQYKIDEMSDPNFDRYQEVKIVKTLKSEIEHGNTRSNDVLCVYHDKAGHTLINCRTFNKLKYQDKQKFASDKRLCYKCLGKHMAKYCDTNPTCSRCQNPHLSIMHPEKRFPENYSQCKYPSDEENEEINSESENREKKTLCSVVCGNPEKTMSCSKTVLCELHHESRPNETFKLYVVLDDMSDTSYIDESLIEPMKLRGHRERYLLCTLESMKSEHEALVINGLWIRGITKDKYYSLPSLYTSCFIPGSLYEVGTPSIVKTIPHLSHFADRFLDLDPTVKPLMLLGRDSGDLMRSVCHGDHAPFIHETPLGYALVGSPCPNNYYKTKVKTTLRSSHEHYSSKNMFPETESPSSIFDEFKDDDVLGLSKDDEKFIAIVNDTIHVNDSGHITISLPFKHDDVKMPCNKLVVYNRTRNTLAKLRNEPEKLSFCIEVMAKNLNSQHVEQIHESETKLEKNGKTWWLPIFVVSQPRKNKHRIVFDSSAKYSNVSLNSVLLQGPDENNRLRGVLLRFRMGEVAFGGDIEAMFYNFHLPKKDRDFLRFFWYKDNKPDNDIVQFRGRVHLFGNKSSPAVAHFGLKYTTLHPEAQIIPKAVSCITDNVYVDDLLASCRTVSAAIKTLEDIRSILQRYHIRLCKIISNKDEVSEHFPESERAKAMEEVNIGDQTVHRTLGLSWQINQDYFFIKTTIPQKPLSRRGMLSVTNSIYDPLGIVNPVVLQGKLIQRKALQRIEGTPAYDWDDPLPVEFSEDWCKWLQSLSSLSDITLPRSYIPDEFGDISSYELHAFTDASESAIGAVIYLRIYNNQGGVHVSYVMSSSKLTPKACISMPRSELCAALIGSKLMREVLYELKIPMNEVFMYCDSEVVLSYLINRERRFAKYVTHRVSSILKLTDVSQWQYISTHLNPADIACRPRSISALQNSVWIRGPDFLWDGTVMDGGFKPIIELPEALEEKFNMKTERSTESPFNSIAEKVSSFNKAIGVMMVILRFRNIILKKLNRTTPKENTPKEMKNEAIRYLISTAQQALYHDTITSLQNKQSSKERSISSFDPFIDTHGILRVGGRLKDSSLNYNEKHPILLHPSHPLTTLVVRHFHDETYHQGRHLTMGAIRFAGYFVEKGSKVIRRLIRECVFCRKLRGRPEEQMMASLPQSRIEQTSPFHNTGVDAFGPFIISDSKSTRQTKATRKIWCLILTCMVSRAIHVELLSGLDTSSFTNALRRFIAVRGTCKNLYSDRGTNFVGYNNQEVSTLSLKDVQAEMQTRDCTWHFNPPHASHFGGAWERKIGALKRIFEGSLSHLKGRVLSRDEFSTIILEATAIVNNTPMWEVTSDPRDPIPISPAMLITLKDSPNPPPLQSYTTDDIASYGANRWRRVQFLADCFWNRWRTYYLASLQERSKWIIKRRNLKIGDVILLRNNSEKRNSWPMAIVKHVKLSSDKLVRSVTVETAAKGDSRRLLERPISEIVLLVPND